MSVDSRYIRIATKFWQDEKVRTLSDDAKMLYLYILTSPHSNMAGYYVLPKPYVAYDLKWLPERLDKAFNELLNQGVIKYCETSDVVFIPNFFKYNPIQNRNQAVGVAKRVSELPANTLQKDFLTVLKRFAEPFLEHFAKGFGNTESDTDTDTDTDTESASDRACAREEKDDDEERGTVREITDAFTETFAYPPNSTQMQMLTSFLDDGLTPWHITEALKRSAEAGAKSPGYTKTILQDWINKKAFTPDDVKRLDETFKPKKKAGARVFGDGYEYKPRERPPKEVFPWLYDDEPVEGDEPEIIKKEA